METKRMRENAAGEEDEDEIIKLLFIYLYVVSVSCMRASMLTHFLLFN